MSTTIDPRRGVPSASGMYRLINCHASFQMEKLAPEDPGDKDTDTGTRIHAALAGEDVELAMRDDETREMCEREAARIHAQWAGTTTGESLKEQRLGLTTLGRVIEVTDDSKAEFIFTGQFDQLEIEGDRGLLIDHKTLHGVHPNALENPQLASLAVLAYLRYGLKSLRVALNQPWRGKPSIADYDVEALEKARVWLLEHLLAERRALPEERKAGDWCKHCKAGKSGRCETFNEAAHRELEVIEPINIAGLDPKTQREAMFARAMELPPQRHVAAYQGLAMIKRYVDAIEGSFKTRVEAGQVPGWEMQNKPGNREITDAQLAFNALAPLGVTTEDALAACSMSIGPLEEAVRRRSGIKSQTAKRTVYNLTADEAKKKLNAALEDAGAIERRADKKVPVMVGNQIEE